MFQIMLLLRYLQQIKAGDLPKTYSFMTITHHIFKGNLSDKYYENEPRLLKKVNLLNGIWRKNRILTHLEQDLIGFRKLIEQ